MSIEQALQKIDELTQAPESAVIRAKARGLLRGYAKRYDADRFHVIELEQIATADLWNPDTKAKSRSFRMAGKKDVLIEEGGNHWLMDHKTCSEDIVDPDAPYWRQLVVEGQHHHYALIEHCNGRRVDGAIWDVTRKPGISPKQIVKADLENLKRYGTYFGDTIPEPEIAALGGDKPVETPALYEARLFHDCTELKPDWYFQRRRIARRDDGLLEYAGELWQHSQDLLWTRRQGCWPRNSGACMNYGRPCQFLGICSGYDEATSENWRLKEWVHPELPQAEGDGRELLTNSRIRCFQTCRRKHFYQFEMGIERVREEDIETLYFGNVWHAALEVLFEKFLKGPAHVDANNGEPVNAVGCTEG